MKLEDSVYGSVQIDEPILLDLLSSQAMLRLQGVLQHGISSLVGITQPVTRYDHSVGVMLLIRRLHGSLEEQIAGLLHDVSHTAFSHVIDYVVGGHHKQSYHDEVKASYLAGTDVPIILEKHGYDWRMVLDEERYRLLEQPAPRLCADRLDYFLRDSMELQLVTQAGVEHVLGQLAVVDGRIMLTDLETARWVAHTYIAADDMSWANLREVGLYELAAQVIRRGLAVGAITEADYWGQDVEVWYRLINYPDAELRRISRLVSPDTRFVWDDTNPTFRVGTKVRTIDPDVIQIGGFNPLSELDDAFARFRETYIASKQGLWPLRVLSF